MANTTYSEFKEKLTNVFTLCGIDVPTDEKINKLYELAELLTDYGKNVNLTAITDTDGIILKHFADCAVLCDAVPEGARVIDVGAGGGFPSLPLAILRDDVRVISLDSTAKKLTFINMAAEKLALPNISTLHGRAEEIANGDLRESFDFVCARAVASLPVLAELCLPFVKKGGLFCAMKADSAQELEACKNTFAKLGGELEGVREITLTDGTETLHRTLITVRKTSATPKQYPRKYSNIKAKPLI